VSWGLEFERHPWGPMPGEQTGDSPVVGDSQRSLPFLMKTYMLMNDPSVDDLISWNEDGTTFVTWWLAELGFRFSLFLIYYK